MSRIAVIPARGGSKRIPRKNIRPFCGKPMIAWPIEAAIKSELFDQVIVSTDDEEIAQVAKEYGASVPFMRPKALADDYATTRAVINHAIDWLHNNDVQTNDLCCIYATSALLQPEMLRESWELLNHSRSHSFCFSVMTYHYPIQRALQIDSEGNLGMFYPEYKESRSQDLTEGYHDAGQFYWGKAEAFLEGKNMYSGEAIPYLVSRWQAQDIDTEEDWKFVEMLVESRK